MHSELTTVGFSGHRDCPRLRTTATVSYEPPKAFMVLGPMVETCQASASRSTLRRKHVSPNSSKEVFCWKLLVLFLKRAFHRSPSVRRLSAGMQPRYVPELSEGGGVCGVGLWPALRPPTLVCTFLRSSSCSIRLR